MVAELEEISMRIKGKLVTEPYPPGPKTGQCWGAIRIKIRAMSKSRPVTWQDLVSENYTNLEYRRAAANLHRMWKAGQLIKLSIGRGGNPPTPARFISPEMGTQTMTLFI